MKKGIIILNILLIIMLFTNSTIFGATQSGHLMDDETMKKVAQKLNLNYTDEEITGLTYQFNEWSRNCYEQNEFSLKNIAFFKLKENGQLMFLLSNATFSDTLPYIYIFSYGNNTNYSTTIEQFVDWKKDTSGKITGANTENIKYWTLLKSTYTENTGKISLNKTKIDTIKAEIITIPDIVTFVNTYTVYAYTGNYGYKTYFLNNYVEIDTGAIIPTPSPTPAPTSTPGSSSAGGTDLTPVIGKIDETNKNLEEIKNNIPTSGDIASATTKGNENFWGNSGDINKYDDQKQAEDLINNTLNNVSGEIEKIEVIKILEDSEKQFWNRFKKPSGTPKDELYDLKISWNDIEYEGITLIEKRRNKLLRTMSRK